MNAMMMCSMAVRHIEVEVVVCDRRVWSSSIRISSRRAVTVAVYIVMALVVGTGRNLCDMGKNETNTTAQKNLKSIGKGVLSLAPATMVSGLCLFFKGRIKSLRHPNLCRLCQTIQGRSLTKESEAGAAGKLDRMCAIMV